MTVLGTVSVPTWKLRTEESVAWRQPHAVSHLQLEGKQPQALTRAFRSNLCIFVYLCGEDTEVRSPSTEDPWSTLTIHGTMTLGGTGTNHHGGLEIHHPVS